MSTKVVVISDLHVGSTVGLCPNYVQLDDGGHYRSSKAQKWLWQCWLNAMDRIDSYVDPEDKLWVVFNGDLVDGNHHRTHQVWTKSEEAQAEAAIGIIDPLVQKADRTFFMRGTWSHVGQSGMWEERIAQDLGGEVEPDTGNSSWAHLIMLCEGVKFDFAHFGKLGYRQWTSPNALNTLAAETILEYVSAGERYPDIVVRSHRHQYKTTADNYPLTVFQTPAWQLASGWVTSYKPGALADVGLIMFDCEEGEWSHELVRYKPRRRQIWKEPKK